MMGMNYRERKIQDLGCRALDAFSGIPPECHSMTLAEYRSWIAKRYSSEAAKNNPGSIAVPPSGISAILLREYIADLTGLKALNCNGSTPLREIVGAIEKP